jgi:predicted flap endonuclease-1-like 5' DNA nuclease
MDLIREYWWLIVIVVVLALAFILLRPKQKVQLTDSTPVRPHMTQRTQPPEGRGLAPVHKKLDGEKELHDNLCMIKGVGPKLAEALHDLGFSRYDQLAHLTPTEVQRLDERLGTFRGRIARDRIVEQAGYLARGDKDGFEQKFGKL